MQSLLGETYTPTLARINPKTHELYVIDEYPGGFPARILVFTPPFVDGMAATRVIFPRQRIAGDYSGGYRLIHATGLVFNPVRTKDWIDERTKTHRYRDGIFWLHDDTRTIDPRTRTLWLYDNLFHRLLRVKNPDDLAGKLLVDVVIGQANKIDYKLNRGMDAPDAASFGDVNDIRFDKLGNLFVVDNTYECHPNGRIIAFLAEELAAITEMFPPIQARLVYVVENFNETNICRVHQSVDRPHSPVSVAFNSRNEMVVGNDGYYHDPRTRHITQLYLYRNPLVKQTPDAVIEFPVGAPGELSFDEEDNLIIQDHTWSKLWVINFDRDPVWLRPVAE